MKLGEIRLDFVGDMNVSNKIRELGVFSFRAFMNIGNASNREREGKATPHTHT